MKARSIASDIYEAAKDVGEGITYILVPGKYALDKEIIGSSFNQRHKLVGYNPLEYLFTPFDFTPVGAVSKFNKGYKAVKGGKRLITMGISGFGKQLQSQGYTDMATAIASKLVGAYVPTDRIMSDLFTAENQRKQNKQSGVGGSLPSKPKTPGKLKPSTKKFLPGYKPYAYKPKSGERCAPGYRWNQRDKMCVEL
jgi:hypothetical protein